MSITGERLRKQRKYLGMSADDVAIELGVSRSTIFRYENGYIEKVPANIIETLANFLHTTPAYLMGWTDDPHDWERIGNENGIFPPKDYEGTYEDYVKYKMYEEQDSLIDEYYDKHPDEDINSPTAKELLTKTNRNYNVYINIHSHNKNQAIYTAVKNMLIANGDAAKASTLTEEEAIRLYEMSGFEAIQIAAEPETIAAHKEGENFTPEELEKIEEYKKLLLAARPKE